MIECSQKDRIDSIDKAINGNGSEGLKQKMARVETKLNFNTWLTLALLGTIIGNLVHTWM